jgi:amino acid transporter
MALKPSIGVGHIVFFVVAAAAPLTSVVGASPAAFAFGNGAGVPGTYLLAGLLYLLFSVGFTAMSAQMRATGGFFLTITLGLGPAMGAAGALVSIATYSAVQLAVLALVGVYLGHALVPLGLVLPWWVYAAGVTGIVTLVGRRQIEVSGNILGACMVAEIAILFLLDLGILRRQGLHGVSSAGFAPATVLGHGLGVSMVFVIGSFMGFEATALFAEEARDPEKAIARATYLAVLLIMGFYAFSTWCIAQHYGADHVAAVARQGMDTFYFQATDTILGGWATALMRGLLIVSLFACALSLHSSINRYLLALGRGGLLPRRLSRIDPRHGAPVTAGRVQSLSALALLAWAAVAGADPYVVVFGWASAFAVLGILSVQIVVCGAIMAFFARQPRRPALHVWAVSPLLAGVGLAACTLCVIANLPLLAGSDSPVLRLFPLAILVIGLLGAATGHAARHRGSPLRAQR